MKIHELEAKLKSLTPEERDVIESIITDGIEADVDTYHVNIEKLRQMGLVYAWTYDGGPISDFFRVRLAMNFA